MCTEALNPRTSCGTLRNDIPSLSLSFQISEIGTVALPFQGCGEDVERSGAVVADSDNA